ncbi:Nitrate reductase [NADH] 1, partial [Spiromyces aspiralis]
LAELFGIPGNSSLDGKKGGDRAIQKGQKHWAWTLWTFKFKVSAIRVASLGELEIACRAWDCSGNCQPSEASWNYRGVMNNSYFRTKIKIIAPTSQL